LVDAMPKIIRKIHDITLKLTRKIINETKVFQPGSIESTKRNCPRK
jgi:hypothetical protein